MNTSSYSEQTLDAIRSALLNDRELDFRREGSMLRQGKCPQCGQRELYISLERPFRLQCGRENKCRFSQTTRERYPEVFSSFARRYPATDESPNAPADAYLRENRGFDLKKIKGMYKLGFCRPQNAVRYLPCVEIPIDVPEFVSEKGCVFKRIIDADDVRYAQKLGDAKAKISGSYKGWGWVPPGMKFEKNDEIWITEGIFKAMAFLMIGKKAISALSCSNFPREIIRKHSGKNIRWIVALDADAAGIAHTEKDLRELEAMNETGFPAVPPDEEHDWDDLYRLGRLDDQFLQKCIGRGLMINAEDEKEYAFYMRALMRTNKNPANYLIFDFMNRLYRCKVKPAESNEERDVFYPFQGGRYAGTEEEIRRERNAFEKLASIEPICDCYPQAVYTEHDPVTKQYKTNIFVQFHDWRRKPRAMTLDGSCLSSADTFSKELLRTTVYIAFNGTNRDLEYLRRRWDASGNKEVNVVDFVGYEHESRIYAFDKFAYRNGVMQSLNDYGYFDYGSACLKSRKTDFPLVDPKELKDFDGSFFPDFHRVFSENGVILLAWWTGSFFAEQLRKRHSSWCFMEYTGERGAGKSTLLRFLWKMTGVIKDIEGRNPNKGTDTAFFRELASLSNLPTIILEADDVLEGRGKNAGMFNFTSLKEFYNFGAITRSVGVKTAGTETKQEVFRGALLISQNKQVQGDKEGALISRFVSCHCTKEHFTKESRLLAERFERMTVQELGGYLHLCLSKEKELLDAYPNLYASAYMELNVHAERTGKIKDDRIIKCHAQVAAWIALLRRLLPVSDEIYDRTLAKLWKNAEMQQRRLSNEDPVMEEFWNIYDYLNLQKDPQTGTSVEVLNHSRNPDYIAINVPDFVRKATDARQKLPETAVLKEKFPASFRHKYVDYKNVNSGIFGRSLKCYIFMKQETES